MDCYGNNNSGGGFTPYSGKPPEYRGRQRLRDILRRPDVHKLVLLTALLGSGVLGHIVLRELYSIVLLAVPELYRAYYASDIVSVLLEMTYTVTCVGVPFIICYAAAYRMRLTDAEIPFGRPSSGADAFFLVIAGVGVCMAGNILNSVFTTYMQSVGVSFHSYDYAVGQAAATPATAAELILFVLHTAVLPAFIEEICFRGCIMQPLRKYGDVYAIVCSSVIFGLLHGNMMQAPFAMIAGAALGFVCVYTGSMWPNIILHLLNNFISLTEGIAVAAAGKYSYFVSVLIIFGLIVTGVLAFIGFYLRNGRTAPLGKGCATRPDVRWRAFFLSPTILVSFIYFAIQILGDVYILS